MGNRAKQRQKQRREQKTPRPEQRAQDGKPVERSTPGWLFLAGALLLVVSNAAAFMLVLQGLGGISLPGCGPESACDRATSSAWGSIPGLGWPVSHVGLAYFLGLIAAWLTSGGCPPAWIRWLARLGGIASLGFIVVMLAGGYVCGYCLAAHLGYLAFLALIEIGRAPSATSGGAAPAAAFVGLGAVATIALVFAEVSRAAEAERRAEGQLAESTRKIIEQDDPPEIEPPPGEPPPGEPFTGRYRVGPEAAPIRIVIISDYQCPDCKRIESELREVLAARDDVSFSAKHFPFCKDCNRRAREANYSPHPNACWAARAAETAGMLQGDDGFLRMHQWLFDRQGSFTDLEIRDALPGLGFDAAEFLGIMQQGETLRLVHEDIEEALSLGLRMTPMIFINGVELTGWNADRALVRAVDRVVATNPPARTAAYDRPPIALDKHLGDWRRQRVRELPADTSVWALGPDDAAATVVMWGDYQEPYTAELDARVRAALSTYDARYVFRHYPIDQSCNEHAARTIHPKACLAHKAAEAAGRLGGNDVYWRMHEWLMTNRPSVDEAGLRGAAGALGLDADALLAEMESPEVAAAIGEDASGAKSMALRGVPFLWVNGKYVRFWRLEGEPLVERMIEEAAGGGPGG